MEVHQLTADPDTITAERVAELPETTLYDPDVFTCNAYLATGERNTLVDAGTLPGIADAVREHVPDLEAVVLTHQHGDHIGQLGAVLEAFDPDLACYGSHPRRTRELADGDEIRIGDGVFEAVYTPGHARDHVAFVGEAVVFSGDLVVPNDEAFEYGSFGSAPPGPARERLIESLETLLARVENPDRLYAGHGDPFEGDVSDLIETALDRAREREPKYD